MARCALTLSTATNAAALKDLLEKTALLILTNVRAVPVLMVGSVMMAWQIIAVSVHRDILVKSLSSFK